MTVLGPRSGAAPVVLLHGVCFGPETMDRPAAALARRVPVLVPHRRGYGESRDLEPGGPVDRHVDDLVEVLDRLELAAAVFVGVSGGATIVLATAIRHPRRVLAAVVHEPVIGSLAPGVHGLISTAAGAVAQASDMGEGAEAMAAILAGPQLWARQGPGVRERIRERGAVVRAEVPGFVAFAPAESDLRGLRRLRLVASIGSRTRPQRVAAGRVLEDVAGADLEVVPMCGHLPQIEAPSALARSALRQHQRATA